MNENKDLFKKIKKLARNKKRKELENEIHNLFQKDLDQFSRKQRVEDGQA